MLSAQCEILEQERRMRELEQSLGDDATESQLAAYGRARDNYEAMGAISSSRASAPFCSASASPKETWSA